MRDDLNWRRNGKNQLKNKGIDQSKNQIKRWWGARPCALISAKVVAHGLVMAGEEGEEAVEWGEGGGQGWGSAKEEAAGGASAQARILMQT